MPRLPRFWRDTPRANKARRGGIAAGDCHPARPAGPICTNAFEKRRSEALQAEWTNERPFIASL
jgi:hypothetical protein